MISRLLRPSALLAFLLVVTSAVQTSWAANGGAAPGSWRLSDILKGILSASIYSILGLVILILGFKIFDRVTPFSLDHEIAEDHNTAAGVVVAGLLIALGIIVAAAIHG